MAMLAEQRRKTKYRLQPYTSLSKSNKRCDGDTSSFGYKLMASMGWSPGKGLGANESGEVDPIKLRLKNDASGVGFKVSEHDALSQQSEFQALLQQLNGGATNGDDSSDKSSKTLRKSIKSLEKQSEQSSVRVHYKKFTRGKDLSRASEKDLRSILGVVSSEVPVIKVEPEPEVPVVDEIADEPESKMYITAGSSEDYFKDKFAKFKNKNKNKVLVRDATSAGDSTCFEDSNVANKRRSVTWGEVDVSYVEKYIKEMADTSGSVDELETSFCTEEVSVKKKKKRKGQVVAEDCVDSVEQNEVEPPMCNGKEKKRKIDDCEESGKENVSDIQDGDSTVPKKKKKKKQKRHASEPEELTSQGEENDFTENTQSVCNEKEILDVNTEPLIKLKKKKKKKKNVVEA